MSEVKVSVEMLQESLRNVTRLAAERQRLVEGTKRSLEAFTSLGMTKAIARASLNWKRQCDALEEAKAEIVELEAALVTAKAEAAQADLLANTPPPVAEPPAKRR